MTGVQTCALPILDTTSEFAFGPENLGLPEDEIIGRIFKTVKDFHIEALMNRSIFELSGGEKQKIACASVNALQPEIVLLDEPSANLDYEATENLREILGLRPPACSLARRSAEIYYKSRVEDLKDEGFQWRL